MYLFWDRYLNFTNFIKCVYEIILRLRVRREILHVDFICYYLLVELFGAPDMCYSSQV